jgi:hypothetical protein
MQEINKVTGTLVYVCIQEPVKAWTGTGPGVAAKPDEWKAGIVLTDEDEVDALETYAAKLGTQISLKKVLTTDFKAQYKIDPPEEAGKKVWVLTLRRSTQLGKTGNPVPPQYAPKVFLKDGQELKDITASQLVGNGSKGSISIDRFDRKKGGSSLYLKNVLVTELVEYQARVAEAGSEFLDDDAPAAEVKQAAPMKTVKKPNKANDKTLYDDVPF